MGKAQGRQLRTAQFLGQAVVAAAAADCRLGAQGVGDEFEYRAGVIIQAPDDPGIDLKRDFGRGQTGPDPLKMRGAVVAPNNPA